jgi:3-methylcrotonyl-CoA carboxylase alpha subunit
LRHAYRDGGRTREVEIQRLGGGRFRLRIDGADIDVEAGRLPDGRLRLTTEGRTVVAQVTASGDRRFVRLGALDFVVDREPPGPRRRASGHGGGLEAPMPGLVTRVLVTAGDEVKKGQPLVALEAMKMEHVIRAPRDGRVARVAAVRGEMVRGGVALIELEEGD